jgi:hypothetical protein
MDVAPPWHTLTAEVCSGETRRCPGGDTVCRQQAAKDGYVPVSLHELCRRDEVHTVPRPAGAALLVGLLLALGLVLWRLRRGA